MHQSHGLAYRITTAVLGLVFVVVSIVIAFVSDRSVGALLAAAVIGLLGVDSILGSLRCRTCLLARLGPLP